MSISAIIPVYNNEETLPRVLGVLGQIASISEIIAVDDASRDNSNRILKQTRGIRVITHEKNRGKGAGIVTGWNAASNETILTVDADLSKLTPQHIEEIITQYRSGAWDMVVAARERTILWGWVSGERIYKKSTVLPYREIAKGVGNGIEQVINHAHRGKRVKIIRLHNVGHVLKYQRELPHTAARQYIKEGWQLVKTEYWLRFRTKLPLAATKQEN